MWLNIACFVRLAEIGEPAFGFFDVRFRPLGHLLQQIAAFEHFRMNFIA